MFYKSVIIIFFLAINIYPQQPQLVWSVRYNSPTNGDDKAKDMTMDSSGNIYVTGLDAYTPGVVTIKYNSLGQQRWLKRFTNGLSIVSIGYKIRTDKDGNVFVMGNDSHGFLIKYDSAGNQKWVAQFTQFNTGFADMAVSKNGFIYVTGYTPRSNVFGDILLVKYNQLGDTVWMRTFNITNNKGAGANSIYLDDSNYIFIAGVVRIKTSIDTVDAFCTVKYDSIGVMKWMRYYKSSFPNRIGQATKIKGDKIGNVYVTGFMQDSTPYQYNNFCTIKYSGDGTQKWVNFYQGIIYGGGTPKDMDVDSIGNVYVTGESPDIGSIFYSYATIKYDTAGNQNWVRRFNSLGIQSNIPASIFLDKFNNIYITGNYSTIKYDSSGNQKWVIENPDSTPPLRFGGMKIIVDKNFNVFINASGQSYSTSGDVLTLKYSQLTNIINTRIKNIDNYKLSQNYPNPFNQFTIINVQLSIAGQVNIKVYDISGKEVKILINEKKKPGEYKVKFDGSNLSTGVYFYTLFVEGNIIETKKLVLIK